VWFDGANGEGPNGKKQVYDWPAFEATVFKYQPRAIIFSDDGPGCRWVGNEQGIAGETNWSTLNRAQVFKGFDRTQELTRGHEDGTHWIPAETDVSIRPGWYYHASEDHKVKTLKELVDIYYASVGRNSNLLLNLPVDRRGLVHEKDAARLKELRTYLDGAFARDVAANQKATASQVRGQASQYEARNVADGNPETYWSTDDGQTRASVDIAFAGPTVLNQVLIQEYLPLGQRVQQFQVEAWQQGRWQPVAAGTTIGYKRILTFPDIKVEKLRLTILAAKGSPAISTLAAFRPPRLVEPPRISRSKEGQVHLQAPDQGLQIFYTLDGSVPKPGHNQYQRPFAATRQVVQAITYDPLTKRGSAPGQETFDVPKQNWRVPGSKEAGKNDPSLAIDDDPATNWFTRDSSQQRLAVDLGQVYTVEGFSYLPPQGRNINGTIARYQFEVSTDGQAWQPVSGGEFSNIRNQPVLQVKKFTAVPARYIRLVSEADIYGARQMSVAELGVITR
jgi:alpha-L-fucosidase